MVVATASEAQLLLLEKMVINTAQLHLVPCVHGGLPNRFVSSSHRAHYGQYKERTCGQHHREAKRFVQGEKGGEGGGAGGMRGAEVRRVRRHVHFYPLLSPMQRCQAPSNTCANSIKS